MLEVDEQVLGAASWLPDERTKRGRHACGYRLWMEATTCVEDCVLVNYRSAESGASPLVVWQCPGCGEPLKLWWSVEAWVAWMTG